MLTQNPLNFCNQWQHLNIPRKENESTSGKDQCIFQYVADKYVSV